MRRQLQPFFYSFLVLCWAFSFFPVHAMEEAGKTPRGFRRSISRALKGEFLMTLNDHRVFLEETLLAPSKKKEKLVITSFSNSEAFPSVSESFLSDFLLWFCEASEGKAKRRLMIYTDEAGLETFSKVLRSYEEKLRQRYLRAAKCPGLDVFPTGYCQSNLLMKEDGLFVSSSHPWLSLEGCKGGLCPIQKDLWMTPVLRGRRAREGFHMAFEGLQKAHQQTLNDLHDGSLRRAQAAELVEIFAEPSAIDSKSSQHYEDDLALIGNSASLPPLHEEGDGDESDHQSIGSDYGENDLPSIKAEGED